MQVKVPRRIPHDQRRERRQQIARWVGENKKTAPEAARHFKVSVRTVQGACQEFQVPLSRIRVQLAGAGRPRLRVVRERTCAAV